MSTGDPPVYRGRCLCGSIRFEVVGPPKYVFHCHCDDCRRNMGAAIATFAGFKVQGVFRWTGGVPGSYASSPGVTRRFCGRCGTPLSYEAERYPDEIHLSIGAFDDPGALPPQFHVFTKERIPWFDAADALPRHRGSTDGG